MKGGNDNDLVGDFNEPGVSFTTELSIAYRYGKDRAYNDLSTLQEICGGDLRTNDLKTIVVMHFDRASLYRDYEVEVSRLSDLQRSDLEERVLGDVSNVSRYLIGCSIYNDYLIGEIIDGMENYLVGGDDPFLKREVKVAMKGLQAWSSVRKL